MKLKENKKAPNFKLTSTGRSAFELSKIKKILYYIFIPKMILLVALLKQKILVN